MKLLIFSKNLVYGVGGAERSILEEAKKLTTVTPPTYCAVKAAHEFNAERYKLSVPPESRVLYLEPKKLLGRFFYNEYLINRGTLISNFQTMSEQYTHLWTQNLWAPSAILGFKGHKTYYARDETFYNHRPNYFKGLKGVAKSIYNLIDSPGYNVYCRDNIKAIENTDRIISNSEFMANKVQQIFGRNSDIVKPFIDNKLLRRNYFKVNGTVKFEDKGIIILGDSFVKGIETFLKVAYKFPKQKFYVFSRLVSEDLIVGNVTYKPWVNSPENAYKYAKVVLVPSVWEEAFGRVAAESLALDIPCIVRDIGGLPEAVKYQEQYIAGDLNGFILRLKDILSNYG